jgi:L-alanine-DL-glutamate epimerase-like enolase superfamily enzyme
MNMPIDTKFRKIKSMNFGLITTRLKQSYHLSFATIDKLDALWILIEDDTGHIGLGETVPLPGYSKESLDSIVDTVRQVKSQIIGTTFSTAIKKMTLLSKQYPFSASAVATALDFSDWTKKIKKIKPIELVYPISSDANRNSIAAQIQNGLKSEYRHFKLKIGRDLKTDIDSAIFALDELQKEEHTLRCDANQGYSNQEALEFCRSIEKQQNRNFLWLEQPLPQTNWNEIEYLCNRTTVPIMLDESIYNQSDIYRAKSIGCEAIKLKLFKCAGLDACLKLAVTAYTSGLKVVLGNGVASDIGNFCEALIIASEPKLFASGAECNGFIKLKNRLLFKDLDMHRGSLVWNGGGELCMKDIMKTLQNSSSRIFE